MALKHSVYDTDTHFSINPITRALQNESHSKTSLIQYDHNSERITFEIPRYIEGHDMSQCDVIQVHYNNIDASTKAQSKGVYEVDDMQLSPDDDNVVILSWLISHNATKFVGSLNFLVRFACTDDEGNIVYAWNTAVYSGISISTGINNSEAIVEEYADILEQWRKELEEAAGSGNGGSGVAARGISNAYVDANGYLHIEYTDNTASVSNVSLKGKDGVDGADGKDGASVTVTSVEESTTDGGSNVVTFSDGQALTVKNGRKGADGKSSYDYAKNGGYTGTEDEFAEGINPDNINANSINFISTELAKRGQLKPEYANSTAECTDTSKLYVLPDGYIYAHIKQTVNTPHNANDGTLNINSRPKANESITSSLATYYGMVCSHPIAIDNTWDDCILNISGLEKLYPTWYYSFIIWYYDTDGNWIGYKEPTNFGFSSGDTEIPLPISIDIAQHNWSNAGYIRIGVGIKDNTIQLTNDDIENLTINLERFNVVEEQYVWDSTGHAFVPADYEDRIVNLEGNVDEMQTDIEKLQEAVKTTPSQSGAVWYAVGDSITKGYGVDANSCWVKYVMQYNGYDSEKSKNLGISGLGFAKTDPNYNKTARTVVGENDFSNVDLVTIAIGINDWKEPFSIDTVKSEMRYCFEKILTDNPYCKIIFIAPFNMRNKGNESTNWALGYSGSDVTGGTLQDFINTQKSICEEYNIQVIDMTKDSILNKKNINTLLYDGIHPDAECHKVLGRELARRITYA